MEQQKLISFLRSAGKGSFILIIAISFILLPSFSSATYLIELQNGAKFITHGYWKEKNLIKFYHYGGIVGVDKDRIIRLEETDLESQKEIKSVEKAKIVSEPIKQESKKQEKSTNVASKGKNKDEKPDNQILKELDRLKEEEKTLDKKEDKGLYQFAKELMALKRKIVSTGSGHIYGGQLVELEDMLDNVEDTLKLRQGKS